MKLGELLPVTLPSGLSPDLSITKLAFDSRQVEPGTLFFAVPGTRVDGHQYLSQAFDSGAVAAVVERRECLDQWKKAVWVEDVRETLALCASRWFDNPSEHLKLVGITGTNGKTTTAFLLFQVWEQLGLVPGLLGTVETRIGKVRRSSELTTPDPLTVQQSLREMVDAGVEWATMEVSSIALDQSRTAGSHFSAAVFTNFTQDHLDYHENFDAYFAAKRKLFEDHAVDFRIFNGDDDWAKRLVQPGDAVFGWADGANCRLSEPRYSMLGSQCRLHLGQGEFVLKTPLIGAHNLSNCAAVVAVCHRLGLDVPAVLEALARCPGAPGRLERAAGDENGGPYVYVDYAHTDDALRNVLSALQPLKGNGRLITVFGCGGIRDPSKRPRMAEVVCRLSDVTVATSDNPRTEEPSRILDDVEKGILRDQTEYHREVDRRRAIHLALTLATPEDLVLVAGKGHEDYQILGTEKIHFDDREVVQEFFSR